MSQNNIDDLMAVPGNAFVFNKLVKFSVYMVLCPLAVLLLLMKVILPFIGITNGNTINTISSIAAVITVNIVIFVYVYGAFNENLECDKEKED